MCIYNKESKLTEQKYQDIGFEFAGIYKSIDSSSNLDKVEKQIMQRKIIETHAATKYYRWDPKSKENPLDVVKATY